MATATEMTIALGRTLYGAPHDYTDGEDTIESEMIEGCETRVSVTWRLTEGDQNLLLTASLLAEKTVQALETADRTIRCKTQTPVPIERIPEKTERVPDTQPGRVPTPEVPPAYGPTAAGTTPPGSAAPGNGASPVSGASGSGANGNGTAIRSFATTYVPRITKAQSLAIQSLCTRHGMADWELKRLVWEQFAKKEQSELTKEQAGELLNLLQQSAAEGDTHAYA